MVTVFAPWNSFKQHEKSFIAHYYHMQTLCAMIFFMNINGFASVCLTHCVTRFLKSSHSFFVVFISAGRMRIPHDMRFR